jgi:PAS domain S-box-containing protein
LKEQRLTQSNDPMPEVLDESLEREVEQRISQQVRVRLLIAFPLLIVLLLTIVGGLLYQLVEAEFGLTAASAARHGAERQMGDFAKVWILAMMVMDVGGAIIGFAIAYSITSPIRRLVRLSQRIAAGDMTQRSNIQRSDDFVALGRSFDSMVDSLNRFIELRNRFILESFTGGLLTLDVHGTITAMNSAAEQLLGVDSHAATGRTFEQVLAAQEFELLRHAIRQALWGKQSLRSRRITILTPEGSPRPLLVNTSPMVEKDGSPFGLIVNMRDLEEWERFHREMARTDQLAALGTFAAGLAHELRNPLGAIRGLAQLLGEEPSLPERCREYTRVIERECERLDALVREIHEFSQPSEQPDREVHIEEVVRRAMTLARCNLQTPPAADVKIIDELNAVPPVRVDEQRLVQALMNVITNAIEATPAGGEVRLRTRWWPEHDLPATIEIENTGSPVDPQIMEKIFEPFFTTKAKGTGLGLAIAQQIVANHCGRIWLENTEGGVRVTIALPCNVPGGETTASTETDQTQENSQG